jgi:hypothetical protein
VRTACALALLVNGDVVEIERGIEIIESSVHGLHGLGGPRGVIRLVLA